MAQYALLLMCIATCVLRIRAISNREWRNMNRKINLMKLNFDHEKLNFDSEIARLKFETTDLRTELERERERTDELERAQNATAVDVIGDVGDDVNHAALQKINTQLTTQSRRIHALERSVVDLQQANVAVLTELATCRSTTTHTQANMATLSAHDTRLATLAANITGVLKDVSDITDHLYTTDNGHASETAIKKMDTFAKSIQLAFQSEKMRLRTITAGLERGSNGVQEETVNVINRTIDAVRAVAEGNLAAIDRLETIVNVTAKDVADLQQAVDDDKLRPCYGDDTGTSRPPTTPRADTTTPRADTTTPRADTTTTRAYLVTMRPCRPKIYCTRGEAREKEIKVGSRVVPGRYYRYNNQKGAGTVTGIHRGDPDMMRVKWDIGLRDTRIYIHRYDLFLLGQNCHCI